MSRLNYLLNSGSHILNAVTTASHTFRPSVWEVLFTFQLGYLPDVYTSESGGLNSELGQPPSWELLHKQTAGDPVIILWV